MNNLPLQPLAWFDGGDTYGGDDLHAESPLHYYVVERDTLDMFTVRYAPNSGAAKYATGFATIDEAKQWAWNHYNEKMQPYVKPDSITDIRNWFKAAKPEPTAKDACTQMGCHFEEVAEMATAIRAHNSADIISEIGDLLKSALPQSAENYLNKSDHIELLDALCDQIVTATGVAYMMGFDIEGALKEVIRSNNSKMVDGKFEFDDNGKIKKPDSYSEPDLAPFISTMQNLHKGERCE